MNASNASFAVVGLLALVLSACGAHQVMPDGSSGPEAGSDAGPGDRIVPPESGVVDVVDTFTTAPHEPFPQVPNQGGPILQHPAVITITYADYPYRDIVESFDAWVVGSNWLRTVGSEYGVGAGTLVGNVRLPQNAPTSLTSDQIATIIADGVRAGTFPQPPDGLANALYVIFFPETTTITLTAGGQSSTSCTEFGGYHDETTVAGTTFSYAAIPLCPMFQPGLSEIGMVEVAASHELIEAATDAQPLSHPAYQLTVTDPSPWILLGGEVGDLCEGNYVTESMFTVQQVWSNTAAASGGNPCIPSSPGPYFNVSTTPNEIHYMNAGDTLTLPVTGWSTSRVPDWTVEAVPFGTFMPDALIVPSRFNNGRMGTLRVTVPPTTPSGSIAGVMLYSTTTSMEFHPWPVAIVVN